jgi:RNA polymerase sigma factor (TIGR02999 family)
MSDAGTSADLVFGLAYDELRRLAHAVRRNRPDATISTTELLHEAWFKLQPMSQLGIEDELHLKRVVARAMRQVLIDGARRHAVRARHRREHAAEITAAEAREDQLAAALLDLDRALAELAQVDARRAAVVECRFFGDMDVEETARALELSTATVKRDWRLARAWLAQALKTDE